MRRLEKLIGEDPVTMSQKEFKGEDAKLKYLLHKYAYEQASDSRPAGGMLRKAKAPRAKDKMHFPFIKQARSRETTIPYSHKPKCLNYLSLKESTNTEILGGPALDNASLLLHEQSNHQSSSRLLPQSSRSRLARSVEGPFQQARPNRSAFSVQSIADRQKMFRLLDGTSFLQARPTVRLPEIRRNPKSLLPYLIT